MIKILKKKIKRKKKKYFIKNKIEHLKKNLNVSHDYKKFQLYLMLELNYEIRTNAY